MSAPAPAAPAEEVPPLEGMERMVGAIVLTLRQRTGVRRQSIAAKIARTRATAIEVRQVKPGQGI